MESIFKFLLASLLIVSIFEYAKCNNNSRVDDELACMCFLFFFKFSFYKTLKLKNS